MSKPFEASYGGTTESQLVRDVIYTCQGIDGEAIKYDDRAEAYVLKKSIKTPESTRALLKYLCELGVLYRRVRTYILRDQQLRAPQGGLAVQALCASLQGHLTDYYRLLAILEGQAHEPVPAHRAHQQGGASVASHTYMSLLRLSVWLAEPMEHMRILAAAIDSCQALQGGALAGAVHGQMQHGDPIVNSVLVSLLADCCVPFMEAIQRWVLQGELRDPFSEFLVAANEGVSDNELWHEGYRLQGSMRPGFIPPELAERILQTGKSINFLRRCCADSGWVSRTLASTATAAAQQRWEMETVSKHVEEAAARINTHLLQVLHDKYRFLDHCLAIKRYLLLGQGDFMAALMDGVGEELNKNSADVSKFQLTGTLLLALNRSNAQFDDTDLQNRLQVKLLPPLTAMAKGWDVFTLEYLVDPPLSAVFTEGALEQYEAIFNFLWRLKRGEHALSGAWRSLKEVERYGGKGGGRGSGVARVLRQCHALRHLITHVLTNLQYYIMLEVVEASWAAFHADASSAADLDTLIAAHHKYVTAVQEKALLGPACREVYKELMVMVGCALDFRILTRAVLLHVAQLHSASFREGGGKGKKEASPTAIAPLALQQFGASIKILSSRFSTHFRRFMVALSQQKTVDVHFLAFRLDFSEYFLRMNDKMQASGMQHQV